VADVADQARAAGEDARLETDLAQQLRDELGGVVLAPGELGVCVDVASPGDYVGGVRLQPVVEPRGAAAFSEIIHRRHAHPGGVDEHLRGRLHS
jgi:hypothetical protein